MGRGGLWSKFRKPTKTVRASDVNARMRHLNDVAQVKEEPTAQDGIFSIQLSKDRSLGDHDLVQHYCHTMRCSLSEQQKNDLVDWLQDNRKRPAAEIADHFQQIFARNYNC